jgi:hypothetical protein
MHQQAQIGSVGTENLGTLSGCAAKLGMTWQ